jgi:hypothetical protein
VVTARELAGWRPQRKTVRVDVQGPDGRRWIVTRTPEWVTPDDGKSFEIDADGATGGTWVIIGGLVLLWVGLLLWMPPLVHWPWYFSVPFIVAAVVVVLLWWVRRAWSMTASTDGFAEQGPERHVFVVRGRREARRVMDAMVDKVKMTGRITDEAPPTVPVPPEPPQQPDPPTDPGQHWHWQPPPSP